MMTSLDSVLKSRDITLPTQVPIVKGMVLPVVMYGCESWTIKKAECWRIDAFKLWCWRRHLKVPWTARRSNQSILKEIHPEYSLGGLMLKLKLHYSGHLIWKADIGKDFDCGKDRGQGEKKAAVDEMAGGQHWLNGCGVWANSGRKWMTGKPGALQFTGSQRTGHNIATEQGWWSLMVTEVVWARPKGVTMVSRRWFFSEWVGDWQIGNKKIESIGRRP